MFLWIYNGILCMLGTTCKATLRLQSECKRNLLKAKFMNLSIVFLLLTLSRANVCNDTKCTQLYQAVVLENQLKVLLISDSAAKQGAAGLAISSGSQDNPDD
ncbi:hypothetical protein DSO57_1007210 [Entomophthora muscae]|uniref:Uncharacterized protein n=1 Tax=Entomophthora muscae TaxID=34485 RepID=A0ACC2TIQ8_9FUNG|nr:hypothetical protein DSO57_1007210 [Entomophthora muscae]